MPNCFYWSPAMADASLLYTTKEKTQHMVVGSNFYIHRRRATILLFPHCSSYWFKSMSNHDQWKQKLVLCLPNQIIYSQFTIQQKIIIFIDFEIDQALDIFSRCMTSNRTTDFIEYKYTTIFCKYIKYCQCEPSSTLAMKNWFYC